MDISKFELENGLRVLVRENRFAPVVSLHVWVSVGSAHETDEEAGLAHVHEHMVFKGTKRRKVGMIAREVESHGGEINAYTTLDHTVYHITMASRYFEVGMDVLADAVANAAFDPDELARELQVILEEVKRTNDTPYHKLNTKLFENAYTRHPFRRPVIGYEETIGSFTRERILDFFGRWYVPTNMALIVAGDVDAERVRETAGRLFGTIPGRGTDGAPWPGEPRQTEPRSFFLYEPVNQSYMDLAFHIPGLLHRDVPALDVLSILLGSGESSRLYRTVKDQKQLIQGVWTFSYTPADTGLMVAGCVLQPEKATDAVEAVLSEIARTAAAPLSPREIEKAKRNIEAEFVFEKETVQGQARQLGFLEMAAGDLDFEQKYLENVRSLTAEDLQSAAAKYLTLDNLTAGIVLPRERQGTFDEDAFREAFIAGFESGAGSGSPSPVESEDAPIQAGARIGAAVPEETELVERGGITCAVLPNGLRVLFRQASSVPLVTMRATYLGGTRFEDDRTQGLSNFVSRMLTQGTASRGAEDIAREVEELGGSLAGFSGRSSFGVSADFLSKDFDKGMELFADVLLHSAFDPREMEKKRAEILFAISRREDELSRFLLDIFMRTLYRSHPFRFPVLGTSESVRALVREDLLSFMDRYADPGKMVLCIVGDIEQQRALEAAAACFGDLPAGESDLPKIAGEKRPPEMRAEEVEREKEQAHIFLGFLGARLIDTDRYALEVLNAVLAGQGGRLFLKLRDEMNLAYAVTSMSSEGLEPGFFGVYIATSPGNRETAVEGILEQLKKVNEQPVGEEELERAKRYIIGSFEIDLQTNASQASNMGFNEIYGLGFDEYTRFPGRIEAVTANDVLEAARKYIDIERYALAVIHPPAD